MDSNYFCLYPININIRAKLSGGRKYPRNICIENPKFTEINAILRKLNYKHAAENKRHPQDTMSGRVRIEKLKNKREIVRDLVEMMKKEREKSASSLQIGNEKKLVPKKKKKGKK